MGPLSLRDSRALSYPPCALARGRDLTVEVLEPMASLSSGRLVPFILEVGFLSPTPVVSFRGEFFVTSTDTPRDQTILMLRCFRAEGTDDLDGRRRA